MEIPRDKVGLVIGRKGWRLQEIRDKTGVQVDIKDYKAHLRGPAEQLQKAKKIIEEVLNLVGWTRWALPIMDYTGRLRPKGVPFSDWRYIKG